MDFADSNELKSKRVLVTGAGGFIGARACRWAAERGANVLGLVRCETRSWRLKEIPPGFYVTECDITGFEKLRDCVIGFKPEVIIHTAISYGHPHDANARLEQANITINGMVNLLESAALVPSVSIVHVGSSLAYGHYSQQIKETFPYRPVCMRGALKASQTLICRQMAREIGISLKIINPFSVYGPEEDSAHFIPTAISHALKNEGICLTDRECRHDFVYIDDVIEACFLAATHHGEPGEEFNIGTGVQVTNEEVIATLAEILGKEISIENGYFPVSRHDTNNWVCDVTKAKEMLGFSPRHSLVAGLAKTVEWHKRILGLK
ncbi:MAG: NAD(P)-dependent oxidoreductase [Pseudomonadota bacterium]